VNAAHEPVRAVRARPTAAITRRRAARLAAAGPAMVAAACGSAAGGQPAADPQAAGAPVTITAWLPRATPSQAAYPPYIEQQLARFGSAHPTVRVNSEVAGEAEKLQAAVVSGDPPDIVQSNNIPMFMWASQGALEPIDPFLDRRGKDDFYAFAQNVSTIKGKMYEWPWLQNPTGVVINRSMFAARGAAAVLPQGGVKADWTIEQWRTALRAVASVSGDPERDVYGTAFLAAANSGDYWQLMYLWGNGAELYDKDETRVLINSPEGVGGLQMLVDLVHNDRLAAPNPEQRDYANTLELFLAKRTGLLNGAPAAIAEADRRVGDGRIPPPFEALLMPPPHAPGKRPAAFIGVQSWLVFRQDKDKNRTAGAMRLGSFITDTAAQKEIAPLGELPVRKSAGNVYPDDPNRTTALAILEFGRTMGSFPENGKVRDLWRQAAQAAFTKQKSPKDALDEMARLSQPIMDQSVAGRKA
jgi:ABC-type glycerol-3-phosphate transport system substrate-binding protein